MLVKFNPAKTRSLVISRKATSVNHLSVLMYDQIITEVDSYKHLGVILSNKLSWHIHTEYILLKSWRRINIMHKLKYQLDVLRNNIYILYKTYLGIWLHLI